MQESQKSSIKEAWILCLILGMIMINFPFIQIFNTERLIFGIPILALYFFIGWPASIAVIWFFAHYVEESSQSNSAVMGDKNDP